jgi:hypothetical protein
VHALFVDLVRAARDADVEGAGHGAGDEGDRA